MCTPQCYQHRQCIVGLLQSLRLKKNEHLVIHPVCNVRFSSSVIHVPGVNDIQSTAGSAGQNLAQISRQINSSQVQWSGSRPPFSGQVRVTLHSIFFYLSFQFCSQMYFSIDLPYTVLFHTSTGLWIPCYPFSHYGCNNALICFKESIKWQSIRCIDVTI